jgi:multiple sugar transport system permease protein
VTSSVAIAVIWGWLLHPNYGPVNLLLASVGIAGPKWLSDPAWAMPAVVIVAVWHAIGYNFVLFLAGLKNIPVDLYEAARVDGASDLQRFRHVTLPLLTPTTFFIMVVSIVGSFRSFDTIWVMTAGGPVNATNVLLVRMYELGFQFFRLGEASAIAWLIFTLVMALTALQFRFSRWVHYG